MDNCTAIAIAKVKVESIVIVGRRWFQRSNGNTYHTAEIWVNGNAVRATEMQYGYDNQYLQTAMDCLEDNDYLEGWKAANTHARSYCEDKGIALTYTASDVGRQRDL